MTRVVVVGGGVAGVVAALEANSLGAEVILFERSRSAMPPKSAWPSLLSGDLKPDESGAAASTPPLPEGLSRFGEVVEEVDVARKTARTSRERVKFDSIVIATGSTHLKPSFRGLGKENIFVMAEYGDYLRLRDVLRSFALVAIAGGGPLSLSVAEKITLLGIRTILIAPNGVLSGYLNDSIRGELERRSVNAGLQVVRSQIEGVAGVDRTEAILAGGSVYPAEALICFPTLIPNPPRITVELGRRGGIIVDNRMRSSEAGVYAAGDCAEIRLGSFTSPIMFKSAAKVMGEVAGANAAGGRAVAKLSSTVSHTFFGYEVCYGGLALEEAKTLGMNVLESSTSGRKDGLLCSVLFDRATLAVRGIQIAGERATSFGDAISLIISNEMKLPELAYQESSFTLTSPTDISPIAIAARSGLLMRNRA